MQHFKASYSGNAQFGQNWRFFVPHDLEIWPVTLKNNRASLSCYFKLWASCITRWIQTGVTVHKYPIRVKIGDLFFPCDLEIWWMTLKNIKAPLLRRIKLCASPYENSNWSYGPETVQLGFDLCDLTFDLWPSPCAWTSLLSIVIFPENFLLFFMMIRWW